MGCHGRFPRPISQVFQRPKINLEVEGVSSPSTGAVGIVGSSLVPCDYDRLVCYNKFNVDISLRGLLNWLWRGWL